MKTIVLRFILGVEAILLYGTTLGITAAHGEDFAQSSTAAKLSITNGFRESSLPLLQRIRATELDAVSASLVDKLCPAPCPPSRRQTPGNMLQVTGSHWSLQVLDDGTKTKFVDFDVGKRIHSLAKEQSKKTPMSSLERAGRAFITDKLASVILLDPEEELVPMRTDYRIEGLYNIKSKETIRSVVANRIVFGRTIRGVPIVGGGSTVVLTFANDGSLESFQYDWPKYQTTQGRPIINIQEIRQRVRKVIGIRMGVPTTSAPMTGELKTAEPSTAIDLAKNVRLQSLECGYYDPGLASREVNVPVQPGCVYHAVSISRDGMRSGFSGAVPAVEQVEADANWPEALMLRGTGLGNTPIIPGPSRSQ